MDPTSMRINWMRIMLKPAICPAEPSVAVVCNRRQSKYIEVVVCLKFKIFKKPAKVQSHLQLPSLSVSLFSILHRLHTGILHKRSDHCDNKLKSIKHLNTYIHVPRWPESDCQRCANWPRMIGAYKSIQAFQVICWLSAMQKLRLPRSRSACAHITGSATCFLQVAASC